MTDNKPHIPVKAQTEEWGTPQDLFDELNREFNFTLDAAASDENHKCPKYYTKQNSGLDHSWAGETVFCNPPYNVRDLTDFTNKALAEADNGVTTVFLLPANKTDQGWFHRLWDSDVEFRWIKGRLLYDRPDCKNRAPMASVVVILSPEGG